MDMAAEGEESDGSDESSSEYESDSETASEESGRSPSPVARPRASTSTPPTQAPSRHSAEQPFPSSKQPLPPYTDPSAPSRAPSVATPGSSGSRIRKLSQSLRKSRSMTFGTARPTLSNSADPPLPPPPVPPLPLSVAQSRSAASISARSKPIPPLPSSPSSSRGVSSSSRQAQPPLPHEAVAHKRYPPGQNLPQATTRPKKKQAAAEGLKPPELKKMPELLSIFIEMMRPSLIPQSDGDLMDRRF
jgi:hypothetical protein